MEFKLFTQKLMKGRQGKKKVTPGLRYIHRLQVRSWWKRCIWNVLQDPTWARAGAANNMDEIENRLICVPVVTLMTQATNHTRSIRCTLDLIIGDLRTTSSYWPARSILWFSNSRLLLIHGYLMMKRLTKRTEYRAAFTLPVSTWGLYWRTVPTQYYFACHRWKPDFLVNSSLISLYVNTTKKRVWYWLLRVIDHRPCLRLTIWRWLETIKITLVDWSPNSNDKEIIWRKRFA